MNIINQLEKILQDISRAPKPLQLVVVIASAASDKSTTMLYCSGCRDAVRDMELVQLAGSASQDQSNIEVLISGSIIFFRWRRFQHAYSIEDSIAEEFLLCHLLKSVQKVYWFGVANYNTVMYFNGSGLKYFYTALSQVFSKEILVSMQWIATQMPINYTVSDLLEECRTIIPDFPASLMELSFTDNGQSGKALLAQLPALKSTPITIRSTVNESSAQMLLYAFEQQHTSVSEFFLHAVGAAEWLRYALDVNNAPLIRNLIRVLMASRMSDPYDRNYQHAANLSDLTQCLTVGAEVVDLKQAGCLLQDYDAGRGLADYELLTVCQQLETTQCGKSKDLQVLSKSLQTALIARHNQHIIATQDKQAEQKWFTVAASSSPIEKKLSIFAKVLSTFKMFALFKPDDIELMQRVVQQFKALSASQEMLSELNVHALLANLCELLSKFDTTTARTLEQAYLRPLLYIMGNEHQKTLPMDEDLPINQEKLIAFKQLYQSVTSLYSILQTPEPTRFQDICTLEVGKILQALLVLTEQDVALARWLSSIVEGKFTSATLTQYCTERMDGFEGWVAHLSELDILLNTAVFHSLQEAHLVAQEHVYRALEKIISYTKPGEISISDDERQALIQDIQEYVDFSQLKMDLGLVRHYPLLVLAAQHYERKDLQPEVQHLLSIAFTLRLLHQLTVVNTMQQLLMLSHEWQELVVPTLAGELGRLPQIVVFCGAIYAVLIKLKATENKAEFCLQMLTGLETNLHSSDWGKSLRPWLDTARLAVTSYQTYTLSDVNDLLKLKAIEPTLSPDCRIAFRLIISSRYLSELTQAVKITDRQQQLLSILNNFVQPLAMLWEQHDMTAAVVLVSELSKAIATIAELPIQNLSIETTLLPILKAMQDADTVFIDLEKQKLLRFDASRVCTIVRTGKDYLKAGDMLYQCFQTGKVLITKLESLNFMEKGLQIIGASESTISSIAAVKSAIQMGELKKANEGVDKLSGIVALTPSTSRPVEAIQQVLSNATLLGVANLAASVASIAVTVYYNRKILQEVSGISTEMRQYWSATQCELQKISQCMEHIDSNINFATSSIISHQQQMLHKMQVELEQAIERLSNQIIWVSIRNKFFDIAQRVATLNIAVELKMFTISTQETLAQLYRDLLSEKAGLLSDYLDGTGLEVDGAQKLLFLQAIFNQRLPHLTEWQDCCSAINSFLRQFANHKEELQAFSSLHLKMIRISVQILQALQGITTANCIKDLLKRLQENPEDIRTYQHLHLIAKLCGLPLHQFGEAGFELWCPSSEGLTAAQRTQKEIIEREIFSALQTMLHAADLNTLRSQAALFMRNLLLDSIQVGKAVFADFANDFEKYELLLQGTTSPAIAGPAQRMLLGAPHQRLFSPPTAVQPLLQATAAQPQLVQGGAMDPAL
jgi:hypothetical protein